MVRRWFAAACAALGLSCGTAMAQHTLDHPVGHDAPFVYDSGNLTNPAGKFQLVASVPVTTPNAAWERVYFSKLSLPEGSFVRAISMRDGEVQEIDAKTADMWQNTTAYFNGDTVFLELWAAPGARGVQMTIDHIAIEDGNPALGDPGQCGICGSDDRTSSAVNWSYRIMPVGCTGTIYCRAAVGLSAGHCVDGQGALVLHFNVPNSAANCATIAPPVADQFPVLAGWQFENGGPGADWSVYRIGTNNLGQTPYHRYGVTMSLGTPVASGSSTIRGYGLDTTCTRSQTQQLSPGTINGFSGDSIEFINDVRGGNSGSGFIGPSGTMIGVVTHCRSGCGGTVGTGNIATKVTRAVFVNVRNSFAGACNGTLRLLDVQSAGAVGVAITCSPADVDSLGNGISNFKRVYSDGVNVTLTAPATAGGLCFQSWIINGNPTVSNPVVIAMNADVTAVAQYAACAAPSNNNCASAIDVSAGGTFNGTLVNATNDGTASCGTSGTNPDVWYRYTASGCAGRLTVTTCGTNDMSGQDTGIDTVMALLSACGGSELACNDDWSGTGCAGSDAGLQRDSVLTRDMIQGEQVFIRVSKYGTGPLGPFVLNVSFAPANDLCANATGVTNGTYAFDNRCADTDGFADTAACTSFGSGQVYGDLWYRYTATCTGTVTVSTCGLTSLDTRIHVYNNCPSGANQQIACNDDSCASLQSTVSFPATNGTQYVIRLGSFSTTARGTGQISFACSTCPPCPADYNGSGGTPDDADVSLFFSDWNAGATCADVNHSGGTPDDADVSTFFMLWNQGGC